MGLLVPVAFLLGAGFTMLSSIPQGDSFFWSQFVWALFGIGLIVLFWITDWRTILNHRAVIWGLYGCALILLIVVLVSGPVIRNVRSWIVVGPFTFQPVELVKLALILAYAHYFSRRHVAVAQWGSIATSFVLFAVPAGLVVLQPDLGSTLILFGIWFGFLLVSGLPPRRIALAGFVFLVVGILMWNVGLKEYQKERILGVFYPERDVLGINYSIMQSKIAIGSAGWLGKGYGQGTQTQLGFLTEPAADFIFPAFIEEWGWVAGVVLVVVYISLVFAILRIGVLADRNVEKFFCLGAAIVLSWQFFLNVGSATGMLPVIGVPLPFVSYGGSSLLTSCFLIAIVNSIARKS